VQRGRSRKSLLLSRIDLWRSSAIDSGPFGGGSVDHQVAPRSELPGVSSVLENVRVALGPDSIDHPAGGADGARSLPGLPGDGSQPASQPEAGLSYWRAGVLGLRIGARRPDGGRPW
jgi:hypothetical protein